MVVHLAHGLWREGVWYRSAEIGAITGAVEARVAELRSAKGTTAAQANALIAATTTVGGTTLPVDGARSLVLGDRERLLLALHAVNIGPTLDAVARCVSAACDTTMDVQLTLTDLPAAADVPGTGETDGGALEREIGFDGDGRQWRARVRLLNGGDLEWAARADDVSASAGALVERCLLRLDDEHGQSHTPATLGPQAREALGEAMRRLDPLSETTVSVACPSCGQLSTAALDVGSFLLSFLDREKNIFFDVHRLASAYHWSESDILALSLGRRRRYLELLATGEPA